MVAWHHQATSHYMNQCCPTSMTSDGITKSCWFNSLRPDDKYRQISNIRRTLEGNAIVDHSDVVGASPVGAAPTTSSFSIQHLASMGWAKATAWWDENHLSFDFGCILYWRFYGTWTYLVFSGGFTSAFQKYGRDWRARSVEELHSNLSNKRKTELRKCFMGVFDWSITDNKKIVTSFCGIHSRLEYSYLFYWGL